MYLAGILALCAFLPAPVLGQAVEDPQSGHHDPVAHANHGQTQEPQQSDPSSQQKPDSSQQKPDSSQQTPPPATPEAPANSRENNAGQETPAPQNPQQDSQQEATSPKSGNAAKPANGAKKTHSSAGDQTPKKKVVRRGSTGEPTTQLGTGMSSEQAVRQRQTTSQLLSSTDNALKQISGRQLNENEQEAVTQIRKFMELSKAADKDGDLQRAYKLALKAHLLSDGLVRE